MSDNPPIVFYPGKIRLFHIAINLALMPLLLYLFKIWAWPPTVVHMAVFGLSAMMALRFYRVRAGKPRLMFDDAGIHGEVSYTSADIRGVKPTLGALRLRVDGEGGHGEHLINLWWASKADLREIFAIAVERYGLMDESTDS
jgi:hypothetical protein